MKYLFFIIVVAVIGCKHDNCTPQDTRCKDAIVQVCNTEKDWEKSLDCKSVSVGGLVFKCELNPETKDHECVFKGGGEPFDTAFDTDFSYGEDGDGGMDAGDGG